MNHALILLADIPAPTPEVLSISVGLIIFIVAVVLGIIVLTVFGIYRLFDRSHPKVTKKAKSKTLKK